MAAADHFSSPCDERPSPPPRRTLPRPIASYVLLGACAIAFAACYAFGRGLDATILVCCGAKDSDLILRAHQWWRLASAGFLHADLLHLAVNLFALWNVGPAVERLWGTRRFLLVYAAALVGGNLASLASAVAVSVGASGAIFGLFGALVVFAVRHHRLLARGGRVRLFVSLAVVLGINIALGILVPFIDNAAHAGGFVAGVAAALVLRPAGVLGGSRGLADFLVRLGSAVAVVGMAGSLLMAVRYARASEWMLLVGAEMERHSLDGGELVVSVPKGWKYEPPAGRTGSHRFSRPDVGLIAVHSESFQRSPDAAAFADQVRTQWAKEGAELLASREIIVGDATGVDLQFRRRGTAGAERHRVVIFPSDRGRLVFVTFACLDARYRMLEVLFDRVLHSIQAGRPRRRPAGDERVWEKVAEDPRNPDAAVSLAARYTAEGRSDQAERILLAALRLHPRHADAADQLALLYATARPPYRRPDEAVRWARKALDLKPDTPKYLATLALAYEAAGDGGKALDAARRAAALAPDDATYADLAKRLSR